MTLLEILSALILGPCGLVAVISTIGWWGTVKPRLDHKEHMTKLAEEQKMNAVTITARENDERERTIALAERHLALTERSHGDVRGTDDGRRW